MPSNQNLEKFRRPELFLAELLRKSATGQLLEQSSNVQLLFRATVLAVDVEGGKLENPDGAGSLSSAGTSYAATVGPENPRNSVKARVISEGFDKFISDDGLRTFWPLFPADHISIPVKPGEHVYVIFEDRSFEHGLWICRIPGHEGANVFKGATSFVSVDKTVAESFPDSRSSEPEFPQDDDYAGDVSRKRDLNGLFGG